MAECVSNSLFRLNESARPQLELIWEQTRLRNTEITQIAMLLSSYCYPLPKELESLTVPSKAQSR